MYAIIETGGKQYRVELGMELHVERLTAETGGEVVLDRVLLVADGDATAIGQPLVSGAEVRADVVRQDRGDKVVVFKYKSKTRHRAKRGHRQELTVLRIADIIHDGRSAAKAAAAEAKAEEAEREAAAREAAAQAKRDAAVVEELAAKTKAARDEAKAQTKTGRGRGKAEAKATADEKPKAEATAKADTRAKATAKTAPKASAGAKGGAKSAPAAKSASDAEAEPTAADETTKMDPEADTKPKVDNTKTPRRRNQKDT
jgi:large subunit ribosomal protein L21